MQPRLNELVGKELVELGNANFSGFLTLQWKDKQIVGDRTGEDMNNILELLTGLEGSRFYGALELKYEAGWVVMVKKTETIKPAERSYRNNRGISHDHNS